MGLLDFLQPWRPIASATRLYVDGDLHGALRRLGDLSTPRLSKGRRIQGLLVRAQIHAALGEGQEALDDAASALEQQPDPHRTRQAFLEIHRILMGHRAFHPALKVAELGLKMGADAQNMLLARSESLAALARDDEASAGYRLILARDPEAIAALIGLATLAAGDPNTARQAVLWCGQALHLAAPGGAGDAAYQRILLVLTQAWLTLGEPEKCLDLFGQMPDEAGWVRTYGMARALADQGRTKDAIGLLIQAIQDDLHHPEILKMLRELGSGAVKDLPTWRLRVGLTWRGSHLPKVAEMLPKGMSRSYLVAATTVECALDYVAESLPYQVFEPEIQVLEAEEVSRSREGVPGLLAILGGELVVEEAAS